MPETQFIPVKVPDHPYVVEIGPDLLPQIGSRLGTLLESKLPRLFVITSPEIWRLHGAALQQGFDEPLEVIEVPAGEQHKRLGTIEALVEQLAQKNADRDSILIAFGGGVIGDMAGFVAAIYMRGIRYVGVPTTLLAQVDSSLGGKTGANLAAGKNLIGAFHHPLAVYADTGVLATLSPAELRAGLQESIKAGIIHDRTLFELMEREHAAILAQAPRTLTDVIARSVRVKAEIVAADERESGLRMLLNLGHTLGHAIEAATGYKQLLHGEAVAWGMLAAIRIAAQRAMITADESSRMQRAIALYGPLKPFTATAEDLVARTAKDKKNRSGSRSFVLPTRIGSSTVFRDVSESELLEITRKICSDASNKTTVLIEVQGERLEV